MANTLRMQQVHAIATLLETGRSDREIGRLLEIDRKTVGRYRALLKEGKIETGPKVPTGVAGEIQNGPKVPTGDLAGSRSLAAAYHEIITEKLKGGQHAKSIHYDLRYEHGFGGAYDSVKRYVNKLLEKNPKWVPRLEFPYGDASQVDFGQGAFVCRENGRRRPHLFVLTLCASRKAYREVVWNQKAETFIACLERGFQHFGGISQTLILDNLKAAVIEAIWHDPVFNRKFLLFCQHYGIAPLPCRPGQPQEKGIVENGVQHAQNILKGREFDSLETQNAFLWEWDERVANQRIHGTTKMQVAASFEQEKPYLKKLPDTLFELVEIGFRRVHMDGRIEVAKAFYPVPDKYLGQRVEVRYNERMVRVFDLDGNKIIAHPRTDPGKTAKADFPRSKEVPRSRAAFESGVVSKAHRIGPNTSRFASAAIEARSTQAYRFLQGLPSLQKKYGSDVMEEVSAIAEQQGLFFYKPFVALCQQHQAQLNLNLFCQQNHEIIRDLSDYQALIDD